MWEVEEWVWVDELVQVVQLSNNGSTRNENVYFVVWQYNEVVWQSGRRVVGSILRNLETLRGRGRCCT